MTSFWSRLKSFVAGTDEAPVAGDRVEPVVAGAPAVAAPAPAAPLDERPREPSFDAPPGEPAPDASADALRFGEAPASDAAADEAHWQAVYQARQAWYERLFGALPGDILKMLNLAGVWPGGGLYALPADKVEPGLWLYTTFGLSNPDMPTRVVVADAAVERDEAGRAVRSTGTLQAKPAGAGVVPPPDAAGYGYEFALAVRDSVQWPLWVLQWAANAELLQDVDILDRVVRNDGLTVQDIAIDDGRAVHLLIAKARTPLPFGTALPNGRMDLLVATVITAEEMAWAMQHGRGALLDRLMAAGVGQVSDLGRASVV